MRKTIPWQARQGDVFIEAVSSIPAEATAVKRDAGRIVLAYGEVTGHAHAIRERNVTAFRDPKLDALFLAVSGDMPATLLHEEHGPVELPPGKYVGTIQREYHPEAIRNVQD